MQSIESSVLHGAFSLQGSQLWNQFPKTLQATREPDHLKEVLQNCFLSPYK